MSVPKSKLSLTLIVLLVLSLGLTVYSLWSYGQRPASSLPSGAFQPGGASFRDAPGASGFGSAPNAGAARGGGIQAAPGDGAQPQQNPGGGRRQRPGQLQDGSGSGSGSGPGGSVSGQADSRRTMPAAGGGRPGGAASSSSKYAAGLALYAAIFIAAAGWAAYRLQRRPLQLPRERRVLLLASLLGAGLLLRIAAAPWIPGHTDLNLFRNWAMSAARDLSGFYLHGSSDYPPLYMYVLYLIGKLASLTALSPYSALLLKLPSIAADIATAYVLYRIGRKLLSFEAGWLIAAFYIWNPAILINSTFWGQVDSFFTLIVVGGLWMLANRNIGRASALLAAAVLMKPQGIIYLPVLFFELIRQKRLKPWLIAAGSALAVALPVVLPFSAGQSPLWLLKLYTGTVNEYPYASVNAYNFFALLGANYTKDTTTLLWFDYHTWGMAMIVIVTLYSWLSYAKGGGTKLGPAAALLLIAGVFTFASSMHERYLFHAAAIALLAYALLRDRRLLWLAAGFSTTSFVNTYDILYHAGGREASYSFTMFVTAAANIGLCIYLAIILWDRGRRRSELEQPALSAGPPITPPRTGPSPRRDESIDR
ncbi:hypothetical protein SK3146_03935 [Paenibacillus konkukensis]|uniref:DUF2029 domain-containing protein n=1 Tax=Paenibacillus konkukensis TaxID=2020716 RepID=A0ABY4RRN9_9BACL|nr:dolichyl pyrophosphate Man9GlcNAc2 alpha-1,3-glucosyltransferase [Paenibacillus konkukensis]UQZ84680.1 hypothetical protein SK3146_03935 [Paenibacillus konkukensis]